MSISNLGFRTLVTALVFLGLNTGCRQRAQKSAIASENSRISSQNNVTVNVMAPLTIGGGKVPSAENNAAWQSFREDLAQIKKLGAHAVSTDVWWGYFEPADDNFDWAYYDAVSSAIIDAGLKWVPILSFHQCGSNPGDDCFVPLPAWVWQKVAKAAGVSPDEIKYRSELGNVSPEYISVWSTRWALPEYQTAMKEFRNHYLPKVDSIAEVNISLGPSGEMRYPAYGAHDSGKGGPPNRGLLQSYSKLARESFQKFIAIRYGTSQGQVPNAWPASVKDVAPPEDANAFFASKAYFSSTYGKDFFDWYSDSLLNHGETMLNAAVDIFHRPNQPFTTVDLGAKIPGVHWRIGDIESNENVVLFDRLGELPAGLVRTSTSAQWLSDEGGRGYRETVGVFKRVANRDRNGRVVLHFTCLELPNRRKAEQGYHSLAKFLVQWVGDEAKRQGVIIKGENAIAETLALPESWDRMKDALWSPANAQATYTGITILRMSDILKSSVAKEKFQNLMQ